MRYGEPREYAELLVSWSHYYPQLFLISAVCQHPGRSCMRQGLKATRVLYIWSENITSMPDSVVLWSNVTDRSCKCYTVSNVWSAQVLLSWTGSYKYIGTFCSPAGRRPETWKWSSLDSVPLDTSSPLTFSILPTKMLSIESYQPTYPMVVNRYPYLPSSQVKNILGLN